MSISCGIFEMKSLSVEIESSRKNIPKVEELLAKANADFNVEEQRFRKLLIAVSELVLNAIVHGNKESSVKKVKVTAEYDDEKMIVKVLDEGAGFDVTQIPDPTSAENIRKESGRGIYIVKQLIDRVEYKKTPEGFLIILTVFK